MLALLSNPVSTATVEVKTKKLHNRVESPRYSHPAIRLQSAAMIIELSPQQKQQLFDRSQFRAELTLVSQPSLAYRKCLEQADNLMNQWFDENEPIQMLVAGRAWLIDQALTLAWDHLIGQEADDIALVAVGGYGRGELHPHSDIDILILLRNENGKRHQRAIEQFLTLLWDCNLKVGSSVRTIAECAVEGAADLTIITTMIESRLLSGAPELFAKMKAAIRPEQMWPAKAYLKAKCNEQKLRHRKFNQTEYNLEPNLKSSPGGLRDLHMIGWVARRHYGTDDLEQLVKIGFLIEREHQILVRARDFLWQVRWSLHRLAKRPEDRLLFEYQRTLAREFGYQDIEQGPLAVEQFMQKYYRSIMTLGVLNDLLLQHFDDDILNPDRHLELIPLNERFQIRSEYLDVIDPKIFVQHPPAIIEAFVLMSHHPEIEGMTAETIRAMRDARHVIDNDFRENREVHQFFLALMKAPFGLTSSLRRMARYGILSRYLPEFSHTIGQMQHDLFHNYTVDAHTLLVIKHLRRFNYRESREQFPMACAVKKRLDKPELLYIAGLYHDVGKGRGGDHSSLGARDVRYFAQRHGLTNADTSLVEWLVQNHLVMSITAQRQDLSDPETINNFARIVCDTRRLDYLYCLTIADINATSPTLWNSWRATLLNELFSCTRQALLRGLENPIDKQERIEDTLNHARLMLQMQGEDVQAAEKFWADLDDDYFLRHHASAIVWQTKGIMENKNRTPLILISESPERRYEGGTAIFLYTRDIPHLFAACTAALGELNLSIHDARIMTSTSGFALDTFIVLDAMTRRPLDTKDTHRIQRIQMHLHKMLSNERPPQFNDKSNLIPRQLKHFHGAPRIIISNDLNGLRTIVEIKATDRPGLLAILGQVFMEQQVLIQNAKITTMGEKVEDVFFITDLQGNPISDPAKVKELSDALRASLLAALKPQIR